MELQILKRLESDFLYLQILQELGTKGMPQKHRAGEEEGGLRTGVKVQGEPAWRKGESFGAAFINNDKKKRSGKQLSEGTDLEQLYF